MLCLCWNLPYLKTAIYVGYIFGLIYHFFILITYVKVKGSNLNNSLATTLSLVIHCVPRCNLQHSLQVDVLGTWWTSLANMQQKTQNYVLVWKRSLWRWHNNPCKRISPWLKSHEKKAKVGQDVQRVRLLVKKLENERLTLLTSLYSSRKPWICRCNKHLLPQIVSLITSSSAKQANMGNSLSCDKNIHTLCTTRWMQNWVSHYWQVLYSTKVQKQ